MFDHYLFHYCLVSLIFYIMVDDSENFLGDSINIQYSLNGKVKNDDNSFRILCLNVQSIKNKLDKVHNLITKFQPSVMIFSETHLTNTEAPFYNFNEFNSFHSVRYGRRGGGVAIFIKDYLQSSLIFEKSDEFNNFIGVRIKEFKLDVIGIYRSNNPLNRIGIFYDEFENILECNKNVIIMGDTNFDLLAKSSISTQYNEMINMHGFKILNLISSNMSNFRSCYY